MEIPDLKLVDLVDHPLRRNRVEHQTIAEEAMRIPDTDTMHPVIEQILGAPLDGLTINNNGHDAVRALFLKICIAAKGLRLEPCAADVDGVEVLRDAPIGIGATIDVAGHRGEDVLITAGGFP